MSRDGYRYGGQDHPPNNKHGREASPYSPGNPVVQGFSGISRTSSPILVVRKQAASYLLFRLSDIRGEILKKICSQSAGPPNIEKLRGYHPGEVRYLGIDIGAVTAGAVVAHHPRS